MTLATVIGLVVALYACFGARSEEEVDPQSLIAAMRDLRKTER
jgi:hypothetical protein